MLNMEQHRGSAVRTPINGVPVQKRSKSYRLSYGSCLGAASRFGFTPTLTARRFSTTRRVSKLHNVKEKINADQLALLVKMEWKLSYVTPLYQFRHTKLKSYSRQLSVFITAEKQQGLAVDVDRVQNSYRVSFSLVHGMAGTDDAETVLIQVHSKHMFAKKDEPQKLIWSGWLTCMNGNSDYLGSLPKDFICLPLFGSSGPEDLTSLVQSWFKQNFDCCIGPLEISHTSLQWLAALWTNCHNEDNIQHLKLIWSLPVAPPLQITYTVDPQDAWDLWGSVRKGSGAEKVREEEEPGKIIDIDEVMSFMQGLNSHFYKHFRLDLSSGSLKEVATSLGSAKYNGKIKISNSKYMITTLTLLTEGALLKMPI
ncbi:centromere protein L [Betta splendens]|uniref:Centromere protein L n=1 Tax=Betta splendens TaxID=158456 RepID=A0A6P7P4G8_BETSP|nr:centromere protein L [Betta splendens]